MAELSFLKKITLPKFSFSKDFFTKKHSQVMGLDIGIHSSKVVELQYTEEKAVLKTYGELLSATYLKETESAGGGFLRYIDTEIAKLIKDLIQESNVATRLAVMSLPASSSFITTINLPRAIRSEIDQAIPFEARKYIPIPISEVILDWDIIEKTDDRESVEVIIVAVPREVIDKFRRVAEMAEITPLALEVETFSMVRSLAGHDQTPTAIINIGFQETTLTIVDKARLRNSHYINRGSEELTRILERGLGVNRERAEAIKQEAGLSERIEEREITSVITPLLESLFSEIERFISMYNRRAERKVQKIILTGGGSNLKGLVEFAASRFGIEIARGNPFAKIVSPPFMQPLLREIGPSFSVAAGLALREIATR